MQIVWSNTCATGKFNWSKCNITITITITFFDCVKVQLNIIRLHLNFHKVHPCARCAKNELTPDFLDHCFLTTMMSLFQTLQTQMVQTTIVISDNSVVRSYFMTQVTATQIHQQPFVQGPAPIKRQLYSPLHTIKANTTGMWSFPANNFQFKILCLLSTSANLSESETLSIISTFQKSNARFASARLPNQYRKINTRDVLLVASIATNGFSEGTVNLIWISKYMLRFHLYIVTPNFASWINVLIRIIRYKICYTFLQKHSFLNIKIIF